MGDACMRALNNSRAAYRLLQASKHSTPPTPSPPIREKISTGEFSTHVAYTSPTSSPPANAASSSRALGTYLAAYRFTTNPLTTPQIHKEAFYTFHPGDTHPNAGNRSSPRSPRLSRYRSR